MKTYIKPISRCVILASRENYMLETSMIESGGSGRFDTREQTWDGFDWDDEGAGCDEE